MIGQIIGGGLNMAGQIVSSSMNNEAQKEINQQNIKLAHDQMAWQQQENERVFNRDMQMWDLNNQYNSPQAQRERIEAAGGNAMLAFGNGVNVSPGNSSSYPTLDPAKAIIPELQAYTGWNLGLNAIGDAFQRMELVASQLKTDEVNRDNVKADTVSKLLDNNLTEDTYDYLVEAKRELLNSIIKDNRSKDQDYSIREEHRMLDLQLKNLNIDISELKKLDNQFDYNYKNDVRALRIQSEMLSNVLKQSNISLNKSQQHQILISARKLAQDMNIAKYWDNVQKSLGPIPRDQMSALAQQFTYTAQQIINSIISLF